MFRTILAAGMLVATMPSAMAQSVDQQRKLYALVDAAEEYCPDIKVRFGSRAMIGYDLEPEGAYQAMTAEKDDWFRQFRNIGSRPIVCATLMDKFGPGGSPHLFAFR